MKTDRTERRQIDTLVTRYALAYPHISFQLRQENRQSIRTSGNGDRREVLAGLYGVEIAKQMIEVISKDEDLEITGFHQSDHPDPFEIDLGSSSLSMVDQFKMLLCQLP